jgi:phenylacetic acid degradation operon negative regulatory protein
VPSPTARSLILDLLSTVPRGSVPVRALLRAAGLFGLGANAVRVALARLRSQGLVASDARARYRLAAGAQAVQRQVRSWRRLDELTRTWSGAWLAVHTGALGRSDRPALRRRERALAFLGFHELDPGLAVRPDNLAESSDGLRERLFGLGLETGALVCTLGSLDAERERRARALWRADALRDGYRAMSFRLRRSEKDLATLPRERAMTESFLLGGEAIRLLVFDPLLPDELVPGGERRELLERMRSYDRLGREAWAGALEVDDERAPADVRGAVGAFTARGV